MIALRDYQRRARHESRLLYAAGKRAILFVAPTGAGKTVILGDVVARHIQHTPDARVNLYAHRRELVAQAATTFRAMGLEVGALGEGRSAPVQCLSTQTVVSRGEVDKCTLAVFDEAHHYAAELWGGVAKAHRESGATIVGATATPERGDGRGLDHMFDGLVTVAQVRELVTAGALVPCDVVRPARRVPKGKLARSPCAAHLELFRGRRNVVFAPHVKAARDFAAEFALAGVEVRVVEGETEDATRDASLAAFRAGDVEVLVNCMVLTEGWDCPPCEVVTIARDCGSTGMFLQMAGRGARPSPETGKRGYTLLDLRGVSYVHGRPDEDRLYALEGVGISRGTGDGEVGLRLCKVCGVELPESLVCLGCGKDYGLITPTDAGIALEPWREAMRQEAMRQDPPDKRAVRLARWINDARAKGYKPGWATHKYKAVYGHHAPGVVMSAATKMAAEETP